MKWYSLPIPMWAAMIMWATAMSMGFAAGHAYVSFTPIVMKR